MATHEGTGGNDSLAGTGGSDTYYGGAGNDYIEYGSGGDTVFGGDGDDTIDDRAGIILAGNDTIYGGDGNDRIWSGGDQDVVYGGEGADWINGESGDDSLHGEGGADWIAGAEGNDAIIAGSGDDTVLGDAGNDVAYGGDGADRISGGSGDDTLHGDEGQDVISGDAGDDLAYGGAGNDTMGSFGADGAGHDTFFGGVGNDTLVGGGGNDVLHGDAGNDTMSGGAGDDTAYGGIGSDVFYVASDHQADVLYGGEEGGETDVVAFGNDANASGVTVTYVGDDAATFAYGGGGGASGGYSGVEAVWGTDHADTVDASGSSGGETVWGNGGDDSAIGGSGADSLAGGKGNDRLSGAGGNDSLSGDDGDDRLDGGGGRDSISGGAGADRIRGGAGDDSISTGAGHDVVLLDAAGGADRIADFDLSQAAAGGAFADQIDVGALVDAAGDPVDAWDVVVTDDGQGNARLTFPMGETLVLQGVSPAQMTGAQALHRAGIPCFTAGTLMAVPGGEVPVERLRIGDLVVTRDDGPQPVRWAAARRFGPTELAANARLRPVRIAPGTLGNARPLLVSRQHALLVRVPDGEERLVRACHLLRIDRAWARVANGVRSATYVHLMLDRHQVLLTDGVWSESFFPGPEALKAAGAAARREIALMFPGVVPGLDAAAQHARAVAYGPPARGFVPPKGLRDRSGVLRPPLA